MAFRIFIIGKAGWPDLQGKTEVGGVEVKMRAGDKKTPAARPPSLVRKGEGGR